jgi:hypothetical protein
MADQICNSFRVGHRPGLLDGMPTKHSGFHDVSAFARVVSQN